MRYKTSLRVLWRHDKGSGNILDTTVVTIIAPLDNEINGSHFNIGFVIIALLHEGNS